MALEASEDFPCHWNIAHSRASYIHMHRYPMCRAISQCQEHFKIMYVCMYVLSARASSGMRVWPNA